MSAILPRVERKPPPARRGVAPPRNPQPFIRPGKPVQEYETLLTLAPLLWAAVMLIGVTLVLFALGQGVAELVDRVLYLMAPRH